MSSLRNGMLVSNFLKTPISFPLMSRMWLICDASVAFGSGSVAGSGRKMNAATTVTDVAMGTATALMRNTAMARRMWRISDQPFLSPLGTSGVADGDKNQTNGHDSVWQLVLHLDLHLAIVDPDAVRLDPHPRVEGTGAGLEVVAPAVPRA